MLSYKMLWATYDILNSPIDRPVELDSIILNFTVLSRSQMLLDNNKLSL
jgi:hypothetical protein